MITIKVTQDDIDKGTDRCGYGCPIALAAQRALTNRHIHVGRAITTVFGYTDKRVPNPQEAQDFITLFDRGYSVEPFEFELDIS